MKPFRWIALFLAPATAAYAAERRAAVNDPRAAELPHETVTWDSPSRDARGSMPLGNGDIGLNVWVERDGDLLFYISKTDSWSEIGRLLKIGRVRVRLTPNPFDGPQPFRQTLRMREGVIEIAAGDRPVTLRLRVDANHPEIRLDADGADPFTVEAAVEIWRTTPFQKPVGDVFSCWLYRVARKPDVPATEAPDTVWTGRPDRVVWFHRNEVSAWGPHLRAVEMGDWAEQAPDPLLHRTFGAAMAGPTFVARDPLTLVSSEARSHRLSLAVLTRQTETAAAFVEELNRLADAHGGGDADQKDRGHRAWWAAFWDRSWLRPVVPALEPMRPPPVAVVVEPSDVPLRFGADSAGANRLAGALAGARIYRRALTEREIAAHADGAAPRAAAAGALVGAWDFGARDANRLPNAAGDAPDARILGDVSVTESPAGPALVFGGGYAEAPNTPPLNLTNALTIEAWVRVPSNTVGRLVDKSRAGTYQGYGLDLHPAGRLRFLFGQAGVTAPDPLPAGVWTHVAATYEPLSGTFLYIGGARVASRSTRSQPLREHDPHELARAYAAQRFITACAGRGAFPIKFNGSIFNFDMPETWAAPKGEKSWPADADYRRWGGQYWFQNTRHIYWPLLASGDFDLMEPMFRMYFDAWPLARARVERYYGHAGAIFPETIWFWGWGDPVRAKINTKGWVTQYHCGTLEWLALLLDYARHTGDQAMLRDRVLDAADEALLFYELRYPDRDERGRMILYPSQALETWQDAANPANEIAGLRWIVDRLLDLPPELTGEARRANWTRLRDLLPPLPVKTDDQGRRFIAAAEEILDQKRNTENPELYAVHPFRLFGVGKPDLDVALATFEKRLIVGYGNGWDQNDIHAAFLGRTADAARLVRTRAATGWRFPGFWGPNMDWVPDQDHGNVLAMALQTMLMQCEGKRILLFPAWPREWDVEFKLHAPYGAVIDGAYRNGVLERLDVTPPERRADVEILAMLSERVAAPEPAPPRWPADKLGGWFHVDLSAVANRALSDETPGDGRGGWTDQGPRADLRRLPTGRLTLGRVPFDVLDGERAVVVLRSVRQPAGGLPDRTRIPVGRRAQALFFLHAGAWLDADREEHFRYVLRFADGRERTLTVGGHNLRDWIQPDPPTNFPAERGTFSSVAVTVPVPEFGQGSAYRMEWHVPEDLRDVELREIEFIGTGQGVPILLAITGITGEK